jgi:hypothetical protein
METDLRIMKNWVQERLEWMDAKIDHIYYPHNIDGSPLAYPGKTDKTYCEGYQIRKEQDALTIQTLPGAVYGKLYDMLGAELAHSAACPSGQIRFPQAYAAAHTFLVQIVSAQGQCTIIITP